MSIRKTNTARA